MQNEQKQQPQWSNLAIIKAKEFWNKKDNITRGYFNEEHYLKFLKVRTNFSQ